MDKKIELYIINITTCQSQAGAFSMLLGEVNGERQIPIIIGPVEAQSTIIYLRGMKTPRPLTHDLFTRILKALDISILRVLIYKAHESIFYSYIYLKQGNEIIRIDSRTSDAIALAVRAQCPIFINESILEQECLRMKGFNNAQDETPENERPPQKRPSTNHSSQKLEEILAKAIQEENYELAAKIRDQIKSEQQNQIDEL